MAEQEQHPVLLLGRVPLVEVLSWWPVAIIIGTALFWERTALAAASWDVLLLLAAQACSMAVWLWALMAHRHRVLMMASGVLCVLGIVSCWRPWDGLSVW